MLPTLLACALFAADPAAKTSVTGDLKVRSVETGYLTISTKDGKGKIHMRSWDSGVGMWMDNGTGGPMLTLVATDTQTWMGIYPNKNGGKELTPSLALSLYKDKPSIQYLAKDGKIRHVTIEDLRNLPVKKKVKDGSKCVCSSGGPCLCGRGCHCKVCTCKKCPGKKKRQPSCCSCHRRCH